MKALACSGVLLVILSSLAFASAGSAQERWKVVARGSSGSDQVAVVSVAKRRATKFAVRAKMAGTPKTTQVHAVVTCSKIGPLGPVTLSRSQRFALRGSEMRELRLPIPYPENCGVTVIGIRAEYGDRFTVQILVPCTVQTLGALRGKCLA
jgi:hypothetical protein